MSDSPTFQIPKDVIEPIIQAHISAAIVSALSGRERLIEHAVTQVLTQKVDSDGKPSNYSSSVQFVQWAMQNAVRKAVTAMLETEFAKQEEAIRALLTAELKKSKSPLVKQLVEGMTKAFTDPGNLKWRLKVSYGED